MQVRGIALKHFDNKIDALYVNIFLQMLVEVH